MCRNAGGSAPKPPRFNALGPYGWRKKKTGNYPGLHPYGTHLGARVAPQRCPILRMSSERLHLHNESCKRKEQ
jgi:hypothetical protein